MQLSPDIPHFTWAEVTCRHCQRVKVDDRFWRHMGLLEQLRTWWDDPLRVNSGYRCPRHNVEISGAAQSQHLHFATDIQALGADNLVADAVDQLADKAETLGFDGIGRYSTFVHLDLRGTTARWNDR